MMDTPPMGVLGASTCNDTEPWRYYIAVSTSQTKNDLEEYIVPAATWAIFSGEGTNQSIQELERRIVTEWLPTSGYEYGKAPDVEVYLNPDPQNAQYLFLCHVSGTFGKAGKISIPLSAPSITQKIRCFSI